MSKIFHILQFIINRRKNFYKKYLHELADKYGLRWHEGNYTYIIYMGEYMLMDYNDIRSTINSIHWDSVYNEIWNEYTNSFEKVEPAIRYNRIEMGKTTNKKKIEKELVEAIKELKRNEIRLKELKLILDFN